MKQLISFLKDNCVVVSKPKSGIGFNINQPSQVTDIAKLSQLVTSAKPTWVVTEFKEDKYQDDSKNRVIRIYCGPQSSKFDIAESEIETYLNSQ
jgi:hypothetical protein